MNEEKLPHRESAQRPSLIFLAVLMLPYIVWRALWVIGPVTGIIFLGSVVAGYFAMGLAAAFLLLIWVANLIYFAIRRERVLDLIETSDKVWKRLDRVFILDAFFP